MAVILVTVLSTVMTRGIGGTIAELPMSPAEVLLPAGVLSLLLPQAARPSAAATTTAATLVA